MNENINERIKDIAEKAGFIDGTFDGYWIDDGGIERFAKMLISECVGLCDQAAEENARTLYTVTETQEVGPALVAKGSQVQAEKLSQRIKQHFGVEE